MSLTRLHQRRLRAYYRSAGWPCLDNIEIDLLQAGYIERVLNGAAQETIRVTDAGIAVLTQTLASNRGAFDAHERLVQRVARQLADSGRLVFCDLPLRGHVGERWRACRADVYSIRHTTVAAYACPVIHEIKVRRADLLGDIADADKRGAYQSLSCEFFYVVPTGLATLTEIPFDCGVLFADEAGLHPARPAARRNVQPTLGEWMAMARRGAEPAEPGEQQEPLRARN